MDTQKDMHDHEIEDLRKELEEFQTEKERVRQIIGRIGGVPRFQTKLINWVFIVVIVLSLVISFFGGEQWRLGMIELATVTISLKILYMMHRQIKVDHFKFWMLSSIEWRMNEIDKKINKLSKDRD